MRTEDEKRILALVRQCGEIILNAEREELAIRSKAGSANDRL